jgi:hypothetical protein
MASVRVVVHSSLLADGDSHDGATGSILIQHRQQAFVQAAARTPAAPALAEHSGRPMWDNGTERITIKRLGDDQWKEFLLTIEPSQGQRVGEDPCLGGGR